MFKKLAIVLVALLAFGGTVSAYAWWDTLQIEQNAQTLTIGEGATITVGAVVHAEDGKTLVPDEALLGANDTKSYVVTYTIELDKDLAADATLAVSVDNIQVGEVANPGGAIDVAITSGNGAAINGTTDATVVLTVTMANPADAAQYALLAGLPITFDVTFSAS